MLLILTVFGIFLCYPGKKKMHIVWTSSTCFCKWHTVGAPFTKDIKDDYMEWGRRKRVLLDVEIIGSSIKTPNIYALSNATYTIHLSSKTVSTCFLICLVHSCKLSCLFIIMHLQDSNFIGHGSYIYIFEISSYI